MPFRETLVCLAAAQVLLVLPQGSSQLLCISTGHKEAEVWSGQGSCSALMIIPTLSPRERGLISPERQDVNQEEEEEASEAMPWLQGEWWPSDWSCLMGCRLRNPSDALLAGTGLQLFVHSLSSSWLRDWLLGRAVSSRTQTVLLYCVGCAGVG